MKSWYLNKSESAVHRGIQLPTDKKVLLTEQEASLHNFLEEKLITCEAPVDVSECAIADDFVSDKDINSEVPDKSQDVREDNSSRDESAPRLSTENQQ